MGEGLDVPPLPVTAPAAERAARYELVMSAVKAVLAGAWFTSSRGALGGGASAWYSLISAGGMFAAAGEDDWVAAMATVACLLHEAFEYFPWTVGTRGGAGGSQCGLIGCAECACGPRP